MQTIRIYHLHFWRHQTSKKSSIRTYASGGAIWWWLYNRKWRQTHDIKTLLTAYQFFNAVYKYFTWYDIYKMGWGWGWGWGLISSGLVRMQGVSCVVCNKYNNLLFFHSFDNLIFICTQWDYQCSIKRTAVYTNFVGMVSVSTLAFSDPFNRGYPTATYYHYNSLSIQWVNTVRSKFTTPIVLMCLKLHTSQWCF